MVDLWGDILTAEQVKELTARINDGYNISIVGPEQSGKTEFVN